MAYSQEICLKWNNVRSGFVPLNHGSLANAGWYGYAWSGVQYEYVSPIGATAFFTDFNPTSTFPNDRGHLWYGFPVRCLV